MHVFIPVTYNAPLGGLQAHVRVQVEALLRSGHECTVMCKPGPFAEILRALPINVLETTFETPKRDAERAAAAGTYDLVHAHPFNSQIVGLEVARAQQIPFIITYHGMYAANLPSFVDDTDLVISVSAAVRDYLIKSTGCPAERIVVIPNGVDTNVFAPQNVDLIAMAQQYPPLASSQPQPRDRRVFFVSRMDEDKAFILDVVRECWDDLERRRAFDIAWWVAGDGTLRGEMEARAAEFNEAAGRELITFLGWQDEAALPALYSACHLAIAPGRSALESMACATPVIALGSKGYVGLIDSDAALLGVYGNFGGFGQKHDEYVPGTAARDVDRIIYDEHEQRRLGELSQRLISTYFRQSDLDAAILQHYELACRLTPRNVRPSGKSVAVSLPALSFSTADTPRQLSGTWTCPPDKLEAIGVSQAGELELRFDLAESEKVYLQSDSGAFSAPPRHADSWPIEPNRTYELQLSARVAAGKPEVRMWVIEYDAQQRLADSVLLIQEGDNRVTVRTTDSSSCFRVAFRLAGTGAVTLGPIQLFEIETDPDRLVPAPTSLLRSAEIGDYHDYAGENLVFVIGPPRSGTTWVLNLLRSHPDVIAADVDNLDARFSDAKTLETNVFNDTRPFSDAQIKRKFHLLSQQHPGKIIAEKTPVHLLFADRIRRVFPRAALVLTERDGRDVATSLVNVGRDHSAWWKGAPSNVRDAAALWKRYAEAALRCMKRHEPLRIRYETILESPREELVRLQTALGLRLDVLDEQIDACRDGKNIPIPGVFREGKTGGWRGLFSDQDLRDFLDVTGDLLVQFGYEIEPAEQPQASSQTH